MVIVGSNEIIFVVSMFSYVVQCKSKNILHSKEILVKLLWYEFDKRKFLANLCS